MPSPARRTDARLETEGRSTASRERQCAGIIGRAGAYVCMGQIRLFLPRFGPFFHRFFAVFSRCPASWRQDGENAPKTAENGRKMAEIVVPKHPKSYVYPGGLACAGPVPDQQAVRPAKVMHPHHPLQSLLLLGGEVGVCASHRGEVGLAAAAGRDDVRPAFRPESSMRPELASGVQGKGGGTAWRTAG